MPAGRQARDSTGSRCARAATSGSPKFFLGTDSAPHARDAKEAACGCAGIFNAPFALEIYADGVRGGRRARPARGVRLRATAPRFYGLPLNEGGGDARSAPEVDMPEEIEGMSRSMQARR